MFCETLNTQLLLIKMTSEIDSKVNIFNLLMMKSHYLSSV